MWFETAMWSSNKASDTLHIEEAGTVLSCTCKAVVRDFRDGLQHLVLLRFHLESLKLNRILQHMKKQKQSTVLFLHPKKRKRKETLP